MQNDVSTIWCRLPSDIVKKTEHSVAAGCEQQSRIGDAHIFFRADDIAVPGSNFTRLLKIFSHYRVPLCLAVVPAWLTRLRWLTLKGVAQDAGSRWCWHQHGWRHVNHEVEGKKQEFGPTRSRADLAHDIGCGRQRLEKLLGKDFYPVFTPPWNRCDPKALDVLEDLGYAAISRSRGSRPPSSKGLASFEVNVDLHTRKEKTPAAGWHNLFDELQQAIASGRCGIMIHHQRMNQAAFDFLDILLKALKTQKKLQLVHFKEYTAYTQRKNA
jgi:peptidoglycan/xylan/chitin deacetylase (PgdA/CDA1 family)